MKQASFIARRNFCGFCRNSDDNEVVSLNRIVPKVRKILGIELNDEDENATVCTVCVITLNQMDEKRQNMRASFYKKKADSSYIKGDSSMAKLYLNQASKDPTLCKETTTDITNTNGNGLKISEVRSQVEFNSSCDENGCEERSEPSTEVVALVDNLKPTNCLLKPMNENKINRRADNKKHKPSIILSCNECMKNFKTEHFFNKHKRMHRRRKSIIESSKSRKFQCPDCVLTFDAVGEMRTHSLMHKPNLYCTNCNKVFYAKIELDWHKVECDAKHEAVSYEEEIRPSNKRRTRSETRTIKEIQQKKSEYRVVDDDATSLASSYADSTFTGRHKLVEKFINERNQLPQEPPPLEPEVNYDSDGSDDSGHSMLTNFTSVSQRSGRKPRLYCTIHPYSELIVPLIYVNEFKCHDCRASYAHITDMMKHEIKKHRLNPMFTCYECYTKFTRKNYLEMHELAHRPYFTCHQCQHIFPTRRALQSHLNQHLQKSYECVKCCRSFLTVSELKGHMYYDRHENNLKNLKIKKFTKSSLSNNYHNRSRPSQIVYQAFDMIQPSRTKDSRKQKTREWKFYYRPTKTKLYSGFYEKLENVAPQQMFVRTNVSHIVEHVQKEAMAPYEEEDSRDFFTKWDFDENFDFQLFSIESLNGPPSNESINDFNYFQKLDPIYSNLNHILSYTEVMEESEKFDDF